MYLNDSVLVASPQAATIILTIVIGTLYFFFIWPCREAEIGFEEIINIRNTTGN